jgi:hypothetical protein
MYVKQSLREAGFKIINKRKVNLMGLPLGIVIAKDLSLLLNYYR